MMHLAYLICFLQLISYFFCKANREQAHVIKDILRRYEEASGQRVNLDKSSVVFAKVWCSNEEMMYSWSLASKKS